MYIGGYGYNSTHTSFRCAAKDDQHKSMLSVGREARCSTITDWLLNDESGFWLDDSQTDRKEDYPMWHLTSCSLTGSYFSILYTLLFGTTLYPLEGTLWHFGVKIFNWSCERGSFLTSCLGEFTCSLFLCNENVLCLLTLMTNNPTPDF